MRRYLLPPSDPTTSKRQRADSPCVSFDGQAQAVNCSFVFNINSCSSSSSSSSPSLCSSSSHPSLVINWDQTGLLLMPTHNRTYHHRKDKHVQVVALEDKRQITAVTASSMDGQLLPLQLIFTGQDTNHNEQRAVPKDKQTTYLVNKYKWKLEQTKNHWSSLYTMQQYVKAIIQPFINSQIEQHKLENNSHALLIIDCWSVHKSKEFREWMKTNYPKYHIIFVPAGCTGVAQPADVILQRPLKHEYKNKYSLWTTEQMMNSLKSGLKAIDCQLTKDVKSLKPLLVQWLVESWLKLKEKKELIESGWSKIGWGRMLDKDYQIAALTTEKKDNEVAPEDDSAVEEDVDEDEEEEEDEDVSDKDEDEGVEVALARCIRNAEETTERRRSTRSSTYRDANLARLLQDQAVDEFCVLD
jgi:hypothetical protein